MERDEGTFGGHGGLPLYYQRWRGEDRPRAVLALVHGFGEHGGRYPYLVRHLVPGGYTVYALDLRGHGRSPGPRGYIRRWQEYREDVDRFLAMVRGNEPDLPLFLMGHSMGGLIVLEYAVHGGQEGLAGLVVSGPPLGKIGVSPLLLLLSRLLSAVWPSFSRELGKNGAILTQDPEALAAYDADTLVHGRGTARLGTEMTAAAVRVLSRAGHIRVPILLIQGADDRLVPPAAGRAFFERLTADKQHHEYPGGRHETHNDVCREEMLTDLEVWLERRLTAALSSPSG